MANVGAKETPKEKTLQQRVRDLEVQNKQLHIMLTNHDRSLNAITDMVSDLRREVKQ